MADAAKEATNAGGGGASEAAAAAGRAIACANNDDVAIWAHTGTVTSAACHTLYNAIASGGLWARLDPPKAAPKMVGGDRNVSVQRARKRKGFCS